MSEKRLAIPEVRERFRAYQRLNPTWGSLHVVLDDINVQDGHVQECIDYARQHGDEEGAQLGELLLKMTKTQRRKIAHWGWPD